jgi:hypothetical protein
VRSEKNVRAVHAYAEKLLRRNMSTDILEAQVFSAFSSAAPIVCLLHLLHWWIQPKAAMPWVFFWVKPFAPQPAMRDPAV